MNRRGVTTWRPCAAGAMSRKGFTSVELLIALVITAMVGVGVASMMRMVADASEGDADRRSVLVRAHAAQARLKAYVGGALNVLQHDAAQGVAVWLHDQRAENNVHLSELRVLWWDKATSSILMERVQWPENWTDLMIESADVVVPKASDFFVAMIAQRDQGFTVIEPLVDDVEDFTVEFQGATPTASERLRIRLVLRTASGRTEEILLAFGLPYHEQPAV